jgi:predicted rRNA methylase YqxC with S4 and FtsJ domains
MYLNAVDLAKLPVSHTSNGRTINELETLWKEAGKIISSIIPAFTGGTEENLSKGLLAEV